ncbi:MAG: HAD family hydrolase [Chlamydiales bacterium]
MEGFKGIVALDIDGTITKSRHDLHKDVSNFLNHLITEGWCVMFITGRTLAFARPIFSQIEGCFYCGVQNGAALYEMPEEKQLFRHYLSQEMIPELEQFFHAINRPLLFEAGHERGDICYYRPTDFSENDMHYIRFREEISLTKWVARKSFYDLDLPEFAVAKYFAEKTQALWIANELEREFSLNVIVINDAFKPGSYLAHVNHKDASKGNILQEFRHTLGHELRVISAGDDYNDLTMLMESDVKIVMENAPCSLLAVADIVAPGVDRQGIVTALKEAIYERNA